MTCTLCAPACMLPCCSLTIPTQLLLLLHWRRRSSTMCAAGHLAHPAAQQLTARLFSYLRALAHLTPMPLSTGLQLDAAAECVTILCFFQVTLGMAAPLAWLAASQARLFSAHQRERGPAGLPPVRGPSAWLYAAIDDLRHDVIRPFCWVLAVALVGCCWDLAAVASAPPPVQPPPASSTGGY